LAVLVTVNVAAIAFRLNAASPSASGSVRKSKEMDVLTGASKEFKKPLIRAKSKNPDTRIESRCAMPDRSIWLIVGALAAQPQKAQRTRIKRF